MHQARLVQTLPPAGHFIFVNFTWFCSFVRPTQKELGPFSENLSTRLSVITWCHGGHIGVPNKLILWELDSSYVKNFSCSHKFAWMLATWENTLYTKNVKFERDLWTTNEEYMQSRLILQTFGLNCRIPCHLFACHWIRIASIVLCFVLQRTPTNENNGGTLFGGVFSSCSSMLTFWCGRQEEPAVLISRLIITHASHVRNQLSFGLPLECIERNLITRFWTFKHSQSDHACFYHL